MNIPRRWKRNSDGDSFRPSSDANRRPKRSCSRRWIPGGALAAPAAAGTGGRPCRAAAARNVEAASCGAALPSSSSGIASASTAAARPLAEAAASAAPSLSSQSRSMLVASSFAITVTQAPLELSRYYFLF